MMMKFEYYLGIVLMLSVVPNVWLFDGKTRAIVNHYWRPYNGTIPKDAVHVVNDKKKTYIGRGHLFNAGMLIGELTPCSKFLAVSGPPGFDADTVQWIEDNIEVLCSDNPKSFKWIPRAKNQPVKPDLPHIVQGGFEKESLNPLFVGRATVSVKTLNGKENKYITVGKVVPRPGKDAYDKFYYAHDRVEYSENSFEVLTVM